MTSPSSLLLHIQNPVRALLLTEQVRHIKDVQLADNLPADLIITDVSDFMKDAPNRVELPKGPMRLGDVIDRIRYALSGRTQHVEAPQDLHIGPFILRPDENTLVHIKSGETIVLTDKERLLLRVLYNADRHTLDRATLLKNVWNYAETTETHTFETHLYRLRQKLEAFNAQSLITADGMGNYSLNLA